jgi:CRISPR-associated protein (TIGR03986 family)
MKGKVTGIAPDGTLTISVAGQTYSGVTNPEKLAVSNGTLVVFEDVGSEGGMQYRVVKVEGQGKKPPEAPLRRPQRGSQLSRHDYDNRRREPGSTRVSSRGARRGEHTDHAVRAGGGNAAAAAEQARRTEARERAPFNFIRVATERAVTDSPIFHHGAHAEDLYCGELCYAIEALTPLIVGHDQYSVKQAKARPPFENELDDAVRNGWLDGNARQQFSEKKILEPLRPDWLPGAPVVVSGESIKGAVRHLIGALLNAPMERVAERRYSYRANIAFGHRLVHKIAVVDRINLAASGQLELKILDPADALLIDSDSAHRRLGGPSPGALVKASSYPDLELQAGPRRKLRFRNGANATFTINYRYHPYHQGADGRVGYATAHANSRGEPCPRRHPGFLISESALVASKPVPVSAEIVDQYLRTVAVMTNDAWGHRRDHPLHDYHGYPNSANCYWRLQPDDAIYVEVEASSAASMPRIVSLGHHFRYRTAYADTVRCSLILENGNLRYGARAEVTQLKGEGVKSSGGTLSGARLLHGYVNNDYGDHGSLTLGDNDFGRLAGRVAFNHAIEVVDGKDDGKRFINDKCGYYVALKELGSPKPSAVELYLRQESGPHSTPLTGSLWTYGDSVTIKSGALGVENRSAGLRGRKLYLHQGSVNQNRSHCDWLTNPGTEQRAKGIANDRAMLAKYVSAKGTKFQGSVAFQDLRLWELGILLSGMEPDRFAEWLKTHLPAGFPKTRRIVSKLSSAGVPSFAHKLGHARPLGLGSVKLTIDQQRLERLTGKSIAEEKASVLFGKALAALFEKLTDAAAKGAGTTQEPPGENSPLDDHLYAWFRALWFDPNGDCLAYPIGERKERDGSVTRDTPTYHTQVRVEHAKARRSNPKPETRRLVDLEDLP